MGVCESSEADGPETEDAAQEARDRQAALDRRDKFSEENLEKEEQAKKVAQARVVEQDKATKREVNLVLRLEPKLIAIGLMVTNSVTVGELTEEAYDIFSERADVFDVPPKVLGLLPLHSKTKEHLPHDMSMETACADAPAIGRVGFMVVHDEEETPPLGWRAKPASDSFWSSGQWVRLESKRAKYRADRDALEEQQRAERARLQAQLEEEERQARERDKVELEAKMASEFLQQQQRAAAPAPTASHANPTDSLDDLLGLGGPPVVVQNSSSMLQPSCLLQPSSTQPPKSAMGLCGLEASAEPAHVALQPQTLHRFDMSTAQNLAPLRLEPNRNAAPSITPTSFEATWATAPDGCEFELELAKPLGMSKLQQILESACVFNIAAMEDSGSGYCKVFHMGQGEDGELLLVQAEVRRRRTLGLVLRAAPSQAQLLQRFERHLRLLFSQKLQMKRK
eukprot:TRINITY_DN13097_c0_g1_i1.p1 TRINITY_DN13097_c0_g1~~TRINITY_DN13097_c0_g1_i1.p1  ORF type:complete len:453 (-),score=118.63 TRINITY_DN13097_c0_g1_i1:207-1565(-)